jgi:hypothetical protein
MRRAGVAGVCVLFGGLLAAAMASEPLREAPLVDAHHYTERTVVVPQMVMETREVVCVEPRPQLVSKRVPVVKRIPVTSMQQRTTVRMMQKKVPMTFCRQVPAPEDSTATICVMKMVPETQKLTGTRKVTRQVPGVERQIVCEDHGHWESSGCTCGCATCAGHTCCGKCPHKRWIPNKIERVVEVPVMKTETFDEPYEYEVTRMKATTAKRKLTLREYGDVKKSSEERMVTMLVPERVCETVPVTTCTCRLDYETKQCTVMVPTKVIKEIQVPVCKMVPMTIQGPQ